MECRKFFGTGAIINVFLLEMSMRILHREQYFLSSISLLRLIAIVPFFIEIFRQYHLDGTITTDFSVLASTTSIIFVMRSFKTMRLFRVNALQVECNVD